MDQKALHAGRNAACRRKKQEGGRKDVKHNEAVSFKKLTREKNTRGIGEKHIVVCILHLPDILEALG